MEVDQRDIVNETVEAIVNPANERLQHAGGCAAAISRAAGSILDSESENYVKAMGELEVGKCTYTTAGNMALQGVKFVIHTVGPVFNNGEPVLMQQIKLFNAVFNALKMANSLGCKSIAIPAISSGIFGFPVPLCAQVIFSAIHNFIK